MRRLIPIPLILGFALFLLPVRGAEKDPAKADLGKMQGTWLAVTTEVDGLLLGEDLTTGLKLIIKGDTLSVSGVDLIVKEYGAGTFKIDPSTMPKSIDFKVGKGDRQGNEVEAIYEVKDDELRICAQLVGKERPATFGTKEGQNRVYITLKRAQP